MDDIVKGIEKYADTSGAYDVLQLKQTIDYVTLWVNAILGIVVWGLMLGMVLVAVVDLVYLTIPLARYKLDDWGLSEKKFGKFRLVSYDAMQALENAQRAGEVSPLRQYLKLRLKTHIFVACLLTVLLCGGWEWITNFITPIVINIVCKFIQF